MKYQWLKNLVLILSLLLILVNSFLLAKNIGLFYLPGEKEPLAKIREASLTALDYAINLAASLGIDNSERCQEVILKFHREILSASTKEELFLTTIKRGIELQGILDDEFQLLKEEAVLSLLSKYQEELPPNINFIITSSPEGRVKIIDEEGLLKRELSGSLINDLVALGLTETFEVAIEGGNPLIITPRIFASKLAFLEAEVLTLEKELEDLQIDAGYKPLLGEGIVVRLYDAKGGYRNEQIVHDTDIQRVVNDLFSAGALGVEIGGERLIASSSIRCAGPTILVNQKPIAVNPITIKAVGRSNTLKSALKIIQNELQTFGVFMEIEEFDSLVLAKFNR